MNKKTAIIALIVIVCILIIVFFIVRTNKTIVPSGGDINNVSELTNEEKVLEENKTIELSEPDFMQRSGFELVKSDDLQGVDYDKVYSQEEGKAQVNLNYNDKSLSLFVSKYKLFENASDEEPLVYFIGNVEVSYVLGDDDIKNYYYQKGDMFYSISTTEDFNNGELETLINGFDTKIGENY